MHQLNPLSWKSYCCGWHQCPSSMVELPRRDTQTRRSYHQLDRYAQPQTDQQRRHSYIIHYQIGTGTSILDLTIATPSSTDSITSWAVDKEATTGSDHEVIRFEFNTSPIEDTVTHPVCQQFNFKKANWTQFNNTLQNLAPDALL